MKRTMVRDEWLELTEETNAVDYLERAYGFIMETADNPWAWKWVVISLHGSLYGFAIAALRGTNPDRVTYLTSQGERRLISFHEAIRRCQDRRWMRMTVNSKVLVLSRSQQESLRKLKMLLRNELEHFIPKSWSVELHGMPQIGIDVLDVVSFLAFDSGNYVNLSNSAKRRARSLIKRGQRALRSSRLYREDTTPNADGESKQSKGGDD